MFIMRTRPGDPSVQTPGGVPGALIRIDATSNTEAPSLDCGPCPALTIGSKTIHALCQRSNFMTTITPQAK
jgi:hypothetical protein